MIKFNTLYKDNMTYPCKLSELYTSLCKQVGLEAGNTNFINNNYMVLGNPFTNNEDCRTVLSNIAQLAGGFAKIGRDNKVYIKSLKNISNLLTVKYVNAMTVKELNLTMVKVLSEEKNNADEKIDGNNYFDDFEKNEQWGELNSLVVSLSSIDGENTTVQDKDNIKENGLTEITIQDNSFLINQEEREKTIVPIWNSLKGIKYLPFKTQYYGYPYIDSGDMIYIQDTKDNGYISYVFNHTFKFNGSFSGNINTPAMTKTQTAYKNTLDIKTKFKMAERSIDKINGKIQDLVEETSENSEKLTKHEQTIDSMKDTLKSQETKIETVDSKANKAQSTADTATTKANNAQTSADNAQTIANTANTNAQNAQKTANANTTKITTNTTKIAEVEKTVDGITQSVSAVEERVETVESTADSAKTTANTANTNAQKAQTTADNINTNLTTNYYNKTETDTKFNQTASNIELLAEEVNTITGDNSVKNGDFKNELNNWSTSVSNGDISVVDYNNKKYANLTCRNGNTVLIQRVGGLFAGIEYTLKFDIFDNGEVLDISDCGTFSVEISQDKENSEEIISVLSRTINVTKEEQTINLKFTLNQNSKDVLINFKLSLGSYSAYDISAMITNVILSGGSVTEKFSKINVGLDNIESTVSKKVGENEIISKINQSAEAVGIDANKIELTANDVLNLLAGNTINLSGKSIKISSNNFNVDENGNMSANNAKINGGYITLKTTNSNLSNPFLKIVNNNNTNQLFEAGATFMWLTDKDGSSGIRLETNQYTDEGSCLPVIQLLGGDGSFSQVSSQSIFSPNISQTSLEEQKKNFEKLQNGLDIINNTEIYKYNLKSQADGDKKHIGFVIGKNYKYSNEITALDNEGKEVGVDTYSMISVAYKAIQELAEEKADLIKRIETLEKEVNK